MKWQPLYDKIIIELETKQEITSESGFKFNQDLSSSKYTTTIGKVVACGEGRLLASGEVLPMKVKVGDTILFNKINGESLVDEGKEYTILSESNIMAVKE
jgi:chaperonin GroES